MKFIFNKLRGDGQTVKPWEELDSSQRFSVLEGIKLDTDEIPVVAITEGPSRVVITTKRIAWHSNSMSHDICLGEITTVRVPGFMESNKLDLHRLWLITRAGKEYPLETGPDKPFFVLWNFLIRIIDQPEPIA